MMNIPKCMIGAAVGTAAAALGGMIFAGWQIGMGPFRKLFKGFEDDVTAIERKYDVNTRKNEIIFYGASNFRMWKQMDTDLAPYKVQNHGFGGSTDADLVKYADRILFPYEPSIVFFQTGSNDYVNLGGTEEENITQCMNYKKQMFETFHNELPNSQFVIMSGLLLPNRAQYLHLTQEINRQLKFLCEEKDYLYFVDASDMTYNGRAFNRKLFEFDGIHLNHQGQLLWCKKYIKPHLRAMYSPFD